MKITIPELSLVLLVGTSGSGKSTFGQKHFLPTEVVSSDFCRGLVSDDENNQAATKDAFELLHFLVRKRLAAGRLTVVDATNVQPESRKPLIEIAKEYHVLPVAIVLQAPERVCQERNALRADRQFGPHVIRNQAQALRRSMRGLEREGFRYVHVLPGVAEIDGAEVERQPLWNNKKGEHGPFDIIGDVHGCFGELQDLLTRLGYRVERDGREIAVAPPEGRRAVFVGDLVDRGPDSPGVLRLVMGMVAKGQAFCVPGNHDIKLLRKLKGRDVQLTHGLAETMQQLEQEPKEFHNEVAGFLDGLISHYVFDEGRLVVAHAGMKESMQGRSSGAVREFALYGETTGETDEFGLPVRLNWAAEYRGKPLVVYGHTPVAEPQWLNNTVNIDTGCVFGGGITALRYPERETVTVPARRMYYESRRPFLKDDPRLAGKEDRTAQQEHDDVLDLADVTGKRLINTRLVPNIMIREENAAAALEVMSRFAVDPRWLIYLPPTMSPPETSKLPGLLEHPAEAFAYYRHEGVAEVICEQKHMGSRAVVVVCKDEQVAQRRFGLAERAVGAIYTRTGRPFFPDASLERELLAKVQGAVERTGLWQELATGWLCLDCELMPWSAKAQELLRTQYAPVGVSGGAALDAELGLLQSAAERVEGLADLVSRTEKRAEAMKRYVRAYRQYCWPVHSIADLKLAPFHLLASEGAVHADKTHAWHMEILSRLCAAAPELLLTTPWRAVDLTDAASCERAVQWWEELTGAGGEGMVVKPGEFITRGRRGVAQPAIKCRGREYLRIIYGPEYTIETNLERLRARAVHAKRSLASREFALGIEALERFVRREPLRRVHECVFGVLSLESERVDPRL